VDVKEALGKYGVVISHDHGTEIACYCPFHDNKDSPAFFINKKTGLWHCFNPGCAKRGGMRTLARLMGGEEIKIDVTIDDLLRLLDGKEEEKQDWTDAMESIEVDYDDPEDLKSLQYLLDRGYAAVTLRSFEVGYSEQRRRVVLPVRDEDFLVTGLIGRTIVDEDPKYRYSKGFKRATSLFNIQTAKKWDEVVVVEGSLDALMVHQAGYPWVVATLGAQVTDQQVDLLNKHFRKIIVFSDDDRAGNVMRAAILEGTPTKDIRVAIYPDGFEGKDPGDMSEDQIRWTIDNSVDHLSWVLDNVQM